VKHYLLTTVLCLGSALTQAQNRQEVLLQDDWQFSRDKQSWETVSVPHDWAISGPFDKKWDLQTVAIVQNGETQATEKSGRSGSLPWIGEGYYQRRFTIPSDFKGVAELVFDGAMSQPTVFVNGQKAGFWAYGYNTFRIDITKFVKSGENLLEVDLKNQEESSRWYPGAGIYRPVKLVLMPKIHLDEWSICARTLDVNLQKGVANVEVDVNVDNVKEADPSMRMIISIADAGGQVVAARSVVSFGEGFVSRTLSVPSPQLWSPESPYLYTLTVSLRKNGKDVDVKSIKTGIRTVRVSKEKGFQLNGVTRKLKGVCLHHDLGPLGAAVNKAALIRQIKILKDMGCDAIRTSHNMPSQWQMDVCDSLGMMVMAESFDMWLYPKCKNGYAQFFDEWADKDITNLVKANRNHPSIVMWSIGNEIPEQGSEVGRQIAIRLQGLCHSLDPTRPVTQGMDRIDNAMASGFAQAMEVPGMNYRLHRYQAAYDRLQHGFLLGSETASTVSSRGVYYFPVTPTNHGVHPDGQCSGYDVEWCSWSNLPDDDWAWQDDKDWVIGEFVWTGFDYLGEPTPYDEYWPSRSSYFGICDLAGLPKDRYYLYRSHWNKNEHTIHLLPHWSWGKERVGEVTPVYCYTDYDEAELFVNGKSQGRIKKNPSERLDRYRLRWNEVKYEPGEVKVVVYDADGKPAGQKVMKTAGKPAKLQTDVWTQNSTLKADGNDLAYVTVSLVDKNGTLIPDATDQLTFDVSGAGSFRGVCNGDATSLEVFTQPTMKLFAGQLVVVVQAGKEKGQLTLVVKDQQRKLTKKVVIPVV
jgi:beta-galactosidase